MYWILSATFSRVPFSPVPLKLSLRGTSTTFFSQIP